MKIPVIALLLQGIPEGIAVAALTFVLSKAELNWKKICLFGIGLSFIAYAIRLLPITLGVHTIVCLSLLIVFMNAFTDADTVVSIVSSVVSFLALLLFETMSIRIITSVFNITFETFLKNSILRTLIGLPHVVLLFLTGYIVKRCFCDTKKHNLDLIW